MYLILNWAFVISTLLSTLPVMSSAVTTTNNGEQLTPADKLQGLFDELEIRNNNNNAVRIILKPNSIEERSASRPNVLFGTRMTKPDKSELFAQSRRAAFSAWGGKRSAKPGANTDSGQESSSDMENMNEKRGFNSWGGKKRSEDNQSKRGFNSWGGKRGSDDKRGFNSWGGKRMTNEDDMFKVAERGFNSWGGKRGWDVEEGDKGIDDKRGFNSWGGKRDDKRGFNSWGGKRSDYDEKRGFNSWGGKRADGDEDDGLSHSDDTNTMELGSWTNDGDYELGKRGFNSWGGKRGFNSWGGKRGFNSWGGKRGFNSWGGKRGFNSWGGKRGFNSWGGKRFGDLDKKGFNSWGGKRAFQSWGGKRDDTMEHVYDEDKRGFNSWGGKRDADDMEGDEKRGFNSWGGKRSAVASDTESPEAKDKRGFNSWGGKRSGVENEEKESLVGLGEQYSNSESEGHDFAGNKESPTIRKKRSLYEAFEIPVWVDDTRDSSLPGVALAYKRTNFRPWGGKRSDQGSMDIVPNPAIRGNFNAWGGKRSVQLDAKRQFKPWGGKRADYDENMEQETSWPDYRDNRQALLHHILQEFSSRDLWSGKFQY